MRTSQGPYPHLPVHGLLEEAARRWPQKVALIDGARRFTYAQLQALAERFATGLRQAGIRPGDVVGILAPNCAEFEIAFYGSSRAGAVVTTINSGYRERETAFQLENSGARMLVVHPSLLPMAQAARDGAPKLERLIVIASAAQQGGFWELLEGAPESSPPVAIDPADLAVLPYSSGTTGLNKGVMLTHANLTTNAYQFTRRPGEAAAPQHSEVVLVHLPLFHIYGMSVLMNSAVAVGATQVLMGRFDIDELLQLMAKERVTSLYSVPPVALALTQAAQVARTDLSALRLFFSGAAPLSAEVQLKLQGALGATVIQGYGLTEASPYTNTDYMEPHLLRPGSIGPAAADTEERVVDIETGTRPLKAGEVGELQVRGPQVMRGYLNNPEATAQSITPEGWLRTGDVVRMDAEGYVYVLDRIKELIKYKGFQVPPAELEGVLLEHPAVADAAVIGKLDAEAGEVPKAFIVIKRGQTVDAEQLLRFVAARVATFKQVREIEFVEAIPKTPSGKILRRVLVERERAKTS